MKIQLISSKILRAAALAVPALCLTSCLDFDTPSDEFQQNQQEVDVTIYHGAADSIDYMKEISEEGFAEAWADLETPVYQAMTGIYAMRGGKQGGMPEAHAYQRQFCLGPDSYAQYATIPHSDFMYGTITSSYDISSDFNSGPNDCYLMVKNAIVPLLNRPMVDSIPELKAIYLLLVDYSSQEVADLYGPLPFNDYKNNRVENPFVYDDLETIYMNIEANIDTIINCFKHYENRPQWYKDELTNILYANVPLTNDMFTGIQGVETWRKFANSFKLRLAMHISKVNPTLAQQWAEEAVADGVIEETKHEVALFTSGLGVSHPLITVAYSWHDLSLSASFESILMSLNHPYADYLFSKNSDAIVRTGTQSELAPSETPANTRLIGMREGTVPGLGQSVGTNTYCAFSTVSNSGDACMTNTMPPLYLMKLSEVYFLRAEGALRGWDMGGTAEEFYNLGIEYGYLEDRDYDPTYHVQYSDRMEEYMAQEEATDYTYIDPTGNTPDMPSVTKIGVKWDESDTPEVKLEKIITQKYIAGWPYSFEAWTDLRRTGYPKVFPVLNPEDGDGSLSYGQVIRRMTYSLSDPQDLQDLQDTGLDALGGADQQATRLWWDVDAPNF